MRRTFTFLMALMLMIPWVSGQSKGGKLIYSQLDPTELGKKFPSGEKTGGGYFPYKQFAADDFEVSASGMELYGISYISTVPEADMEKLGAEIFMNEADMPGTSVQAYEFTSFEVEELSSTQFKYSVTFPVPLNLTQGTYWLSVYAYSATISAEWYTNDETTVTGNKGKVMAFYDFRGRPIPNPVWADFNGYANQYGAYQNLAFGLLGAPDNNDFGISKILEPVSGTLTADTDVKVRVQNSGLNTQTSFSVMYQVSSTIDGTLTQLAQVTEDIALVDSTLEYGESYEYTFDQTVDLSALKTYSIKASVISDIDEFGGNNSTYTEVINYGNLYTIGEDAVTVKDCQGYFVDDGGVNENYSEAVFDTITFYPESTDMRVSMTVLEESDVYYNDMQGWYFYDGGNTDAPLLASFSNEESGSYWFDNTLVGETVTARNPEGALTLVILKRSAPNGKYAGWIANVGCVEPAAIDFTALSISLGEMDYEYFEKGKETVVNAVVTNKGVDTVARTVYLLENDEVMASMVSDTLVPGQLNTLSFAWTPSLVSDSVNLKVRIESDVTLEDNTVETATAVYRNGILLESFENHVWPNHWYSYNGVSKVWGHTHSSATHGIDAMVYGRYDTLVFPMMMVDPVVPEALKFDTKIGYGKQGFVLISDAVTGPWDTLQVVEYPGSSSAFTVEVDLADYAGEAICIAYTNNGYGNDVIDHVRGAKPYYLANDIFVGNLKVSNSTIKTGTGADFSVALKNYGAEAVMGSSYTVEIKSADSVYFTIPGVNIESQKDAMVSLFGTFAVADTIELFAEVAFENDMLAMNNMSNTVSILVSESIIVGNGDIWNGSTSSSTFITMNKNSSVSETILYPSEVGGYGAINAMQLQYKYTYTEIDTVPIRIYLATTMDSLLIDTTAYDVASWIDTDSLDFVKVYDDMVTFEQSAGYSDWSKQLVVPFDAPFAYDGTENLVVLVVKDSLPIGYKSFTVTGGAPIVPEYKRFIYGTSNNMIDASDLSNITAAASYNFSPCFAWHFDNPGAPVFESTPVTEVNEFETYTYEVEIDYVSAFDMQMTLTEAPAWMELTVVDDTLATLSGVAEAGTYQVRIDVTDGMFSATQIFEVVVKAVPVFTTEAETVLLLGEEFVYNAAVDYNGEGFVTFSTLTEGFTVTDNGDNTASISGTPAACGDIEVTLTATGEVAVDQTFTITVGDVPAITQVADVEMDEVMEYTQAIEVEYAGVGTLVNTLVEGPEGMTYENDTLVWTSVYGMHNVVVVSTDGTYSDTMSFEIKVNAVPAIENYSFDIIEDTDINETITVAYNGDDVPVISGGENLDWLTVTDNGDGTATLTGRTPLEADSASYTTSVLVTTEVHNAVGYITINVKPNSIFGSNAVSFAVYPNPAKDVVTIAKAENATAVIYDITGKVMISKEMTNNVERIDVSEFNSGIYIISVTNEKGTESTRLIIE